MWNVERNNVRRVGRRAAPCSAYARTLGADPTSGDGACGAMSVAQLSNRFLLPPDGVAFETEGLLGYGWLDTPLGKASAGHGGRHFWALVRCTIESNDKRYDVCDGSQGERGRRARLKSQM